MKKEGWDGNSWENSEERDSFYSDVRNLSIVTGQVEGESREEGWLRI